MINCIVVSLNPTNVWIFFEPSHLFLAIDSRISLDFFNGKGQIPFAVKILKEFFVADSV